MLERLITQVGEHPKLAQWQPPLCGDMDMRIDRDGNWHSLGQPLARERMVRLFASVLRREDDGEYYLVTPVEKWRIKVDDLPFVLTDLCEQDDGFWLVGPLGVRCKVNPDHPWAIINQLPAVELWHGNWARLSRPLYYRLAEMAEHRDQGYGVMINDYWCVLAQD
ncbi:DUF1285 domain-containing protein [uncultured Ferrimonas sp.]|uniref:DUF1285 domain-containing protein n=1 Tax=uncultured Ferrimonas sp. TaxID=432640 RepID=UPI00260F96E2|nr:DUF1285 domain-containing protein [uncultured Ferrimonas sp.]